MIIVTKRRIRTVLRHWLIHHPDVLNVGEKDPAWWWVQNFIGELLEWKDSPEYWKEIKVLIKALESKSVFENIENVNSKKDICLNNHLH